MIINKTLSLMKKNAIAIATVSAILTALPVQATVIQMSKSSLCSEGYLNFSTWETTETGSYVFVQTSLYGKTINPIYISSTAFIMEDYTNYGSGTIYGFDTTLTEPNDYFSLTDVVIQSESTNPNQLLNAFSSITGPGATYMKSNTVMYKNLPPIQQGLTTSCKRASNDTFI